MDESKKKERIIVIGAGPVGALAALYAAQRGHEVEVYELRSDLRLTTTTPLNFTKSINLALSERGINAIRQSGRPGLLERILKETIPMRGRMIHGKDITGEIFEQSQDYDIHGRAIYAVDRGGLNKALLDELETMSNVEFFFNHKLTGADFRKNKAWFEVSGEHAANNARDEEVEVPFDLLIGADGAHSAARYHMMKFVRMDYQQEYIDTLWCEFQIPAKEIQSGEDSDSRFRISPNHLHIWPGKEYMFIAIPSLNGSFTSTLFLPAKYFAELESNSNALPAFFNRHFPGVTTLIPPSSLISSFTTNPHLPLISVKCHPYHVVSSGVILGDAAHAMVPFYGQGMNAGLEDVRVLFDIIDKYTTASPSTSNSSSSTPTVTATSPTLISHSQPRPDRSPTEIRATALAEYSTLRRPDAHAINDLALQNYTEMRASVISPTYKLRKWAEEKMSVWFPGSGWQTKYSRVSFGNERYSEVVRKSESQGRVLVGVLVGMVTSPVVLGGVWAWVRWRNRGRGGWARWGLW